jgi:hypothetical protein
MCHPSQLTGRATVANGIEDLWTQHDYLSAVEH